MLKNQVLGFLGGGMMAEALITGMLKSEVINAENIFVSDPDKQRLATLKNKTGINTVKTNIELTQVANWLIMAVKPQVVSEVLLAIKPHITTKHALISFAAGISTAYIASYLSKTPVIRVMPNTPCLVAAGVSALSYGTNAQPEHGQVAEAIFQSVGQTVTVKEELIDAVTGLSGSGPAYMYIILEALTDAGVQVGLPRKTAAILATNTMFGAAKMVLETGEPPGQLKDMVTTPGGTTIAGIYALEDGGLRVTLTDAVRAATEQAKQLSK